MIYLYGAGGHAKVVIDILESLDIAIGGIVDDDESLVEIMSYQVYKPSLLSKINSKDKLIISIGNCDIRKKIAEKLNVVFPEAIIHSKAIVSPHASIDIGTVVMQGVIIQAEAKIGKHCIINTGATVGHECMLEDFVHQASNSTLCGNVRVGERTWIGAGSVVIQGIRIGKGCMIGAGSVVVKDIPDNIEVMGNPARIIKENNRR